jgi:hypothetical protein
MTAVMATLFWLVVSSNCPDNVLTSDFNNCTHNAPLIPQKRQPKRRGTITKKPRAIATVQIWVLNWLGQEVLSKSPSQQFDHPVKGWISSRSEKALKEKIQSD